MSRHSGANCWLCTHLDSDRGGHAILGGLPGLGLSAARFLLPAAWVCCSCGASLSPEGKGGGRGRWIAGSGGHWQPMGGGCSMLRGQHCPPGSWWHSTGRLWYGYRVCLRWEVPLTLTHQEQNSQGPQSSSKHWMALSSCLLRPIDAILSSMRRQPPSPQHHWRHQPPSQAWPCGCLRRCCWWGPPGWRGGHCWCRRPVEGAVVSAVHTATARWPARQLCPPLVPSPITRTH